MLQRPDRHQPSQRGWQHPHTGGRPGGQSGHRETDDQVRSRPPPHQQGRLVNFTHLRLRWTFRDHSVHHDQYQEIGQRTEDRGQASSVANQAFIQSVFPSITCISASCYVTDIYIDICQTSSLLKINKLYKPEILSTFPCHETREDLFHS